MPGGSARPLQCALRFRQPSQLRQCQHVSFSTTAPAAAVLPKQQNHTVRPRSSKRGQSTATATATAPAPYESHPLVISDYMLIGCTIEKDKYDQLQAQHLTKNNQGMIMYIH